MRKSGGAVIHMRNDNIKYLFGNSNVQNVPRIPYETKCIDFLDEWSRRIRTDSDAKRLPDIMTFAFWIRRANILYLAEKFYQKQSSNKYCRIGKGIVFHIAPSNVPINFAYTFVFGIISGNSNIVKVSSKEFSQTEILCRILNKLTEREEFRWVREQNAIVMYGREHQVYTDTFSAQCETRIVWGGDHTIEEIRKSLLVPRSTEITFADRYSFAILSAKKVLEDTEYEIKNLANGFYNDTYLMEQNACSSPHLICWLGDVEDIQKAEIRFWKAVYDVAQKYDLADIKVSEKYTLLCEIAGNIESEKVLCFENLLYVIRLKELPRVITTLRGKYGLFFSYSLQNIEELLSHIDRKVQTCSIYGIDGKELLNLIIEKHLHGIDRIVPVGKTLDISVIWDGYDIVNELSRCIFID